MPCTYRSGSFSAQRSASSSGLRRASAVDRLLDGKCCTRSPRSGKRRRAVEPAALLLECFRRCRERPGKRRPGHEVHERARIWPCRGSWQPPGKNPEGCLNRPSPFKSISTLHPSKSRFSHQFLRFNRSFHLTGHYWYGAQNRNRCRRNVH